MFFNCIIQLKMCFVNNKLQKTIKKLEKDLKKT